MQLYGGKYGPAERIICQRHRARFQVWTPSPLITGQQSCYSSSSSSSSSGKWQHSHTNAISYLYLLSSGHGMASSKRLLSGISPTLCWQTRDEITYTILQHNLATMMLFFVASASGILIIASRTILDDLPLSISDTKSN